MSFNRMVLNASSVDHRLVQILKDSCLWMNVRPIERSSLSLHSFICKKQESVNSRPKVGPISWTTITPKEGTKIKKRNVRIVESTHWMLTHRQIANSLPGGTILREKTNQRECCKFLDQRLNTENESIERLTFNCRSIILCYRWIEPQRPPPLQECKKWWRGHG